MKVSFEVDALLILVASSCGFVVLFALHAAYSGHFDYWPKSSSDLASWIQAIGSVAAIVGIWWSTKHQVASAEKVRVSGERRRELNLTRASLQVSTKVHRSFRHYKRFFTEGEQPVVSVLVQELTALLGMVDLLIQQNPEGLALSVLIDVRMQLTDALSSARRAKNQEGKSIETLLMVMIGSRIHSRARWALRRHVRALADRTQPK